MSFDIECASPDVAFPDANRESYEIIQVGSTVQAMGAAEPFKRHFVTLGQCLEIPGVEVESYTTVKEVLKSFIHAFCGVSMLTSCSVGTPCGLTWTTFSREQLAASSAH